MGLETAGGRTAVEWFQEAARCFVAGHQGCPCCGGQHCVFRSDWGERVEYYCSLCEFSACVDRRSGAYVAVAGDENRLPDSGVVPNLSFLGDDTP
jgi:hypothetical protein